MSIPISQFIPPPPPPTFPPWWCPYVCSLHLCLFLPCKLVHLHHFSREVKSFTDKQKLREFQHHKTSFTTNAEGISLGKKHKRRKKTYKNKPKTIKKMVLGTYISIITLNVSGLNAPTKRHRLAEWIQKQDPYICCLQETHVRHRDTYRLKVRGWKKVFHANGNQKKAGVTIRI